MSHDEKCQNVGKNIKRARLNLSPRMSRERLAEFMSVDPATIYRWEAGKSPVDTDKLKKLSQVLMVPMSQLVEDPSFVAPPLDIEDVVEFIRDVYKTSKDRLAENTKLHERISNLEAEVDEYHSRKPQAAIIRSPPPKKLR